MAMGQTLLVYFTPEPSQWASPLGMPIMTKEHALQYAQEMVGKPSGVGIHVFTVEPFEIVENEQDASYGRIFANYQQEEETHAL